MGNLKLPSRANVSITGRLSRDAELKYTTGQRGFITFDLAHNRYTKQKTKQTDYYEVTLFNGDLDKMIDTLKKGVGVWVLG